MKRLIFIVYLLGMVAQNGNARPINNSDSCKTRSGIYLNAQDYKQGKLSYSNCDSLCGKIRLHHFFSRDFVSVKCKGKKCKLKKDSIFGYKSSTQEDYRFYRNNEKEYNIVEKAGIIIYKYNSIIRSSNGRVMKIQSNYFFSKSLDSPILPLTVLNLKKAFPENIKFHDMLNLEFADGTDISEYYNEGKMYKVNYLLTQSNK